MRKHRYRYHCLSCYWGDLGINNFFFIYLLRHWSRHVPDGAALEAEWNSKFAEYEKKYKVEAAELKSIIYGELPAGWDKALPVSNDHFGYS